MRCSNCNQEMDLNDNRIDKKYCSSRCSQRAYRQRRKGSQLRKYNQPFCLKVEQDGVYNR